MDGTRGAVSKLAMANAAIVAGMTMLPLAGYLLGIGLYSSYVLCRSPQGCDQSDFFAGMFGIPIGVLLLLLGTALAVGGTLVRHDIRSSGPDGADPVEGPGERGAARSGPARIDPSVRSGP